MKQINLKDKISLIVGAAGDIGSGIVKILAEAGSKIIAVDIDRVSGNNLFRLVREKFGTDIFFYECNARKRPEVKKVMKEIFEKFKKIDVLVYCAGYSSFSEFIDLTDEQWDMAMEINLKGAFYFIQEAMPFMIKRKKGNIILIASAATINGSGGGSHYAVSKIGLLGLMKSITYELLPKGIRINAVSPGVIDTKMLRLRYPDTPNVNKKIIEGIPFGRMGTPEDVGNVVSFLASDISEYICGQEIIVDGGRVIYKRPK
ncbi:MAG: SDR family oxidoreductase [Actinobacteria bacterium]|nr:SDR family oxidoreductase [Actinomycetota bacterium]